MISITTTTVSADTEHSTAEWRGQRYEATSKHGSMHALARALVSAGCPDQPWCANGGLHGRSLHYAAATTISEADHAPARVKWTPHPKSTPDPVLMDALRPVWGAMDAQKATRACR